MPKDKVSDPITDQEIAFARLVLSGAITDRHAAEAAGLNPDSAAYTKSKPHVRAFMLEHRAAVQQQLVQQDANEQQRRNLDREKVLDRLWEIANLGPEVTRGSINGQVKAISMIVAIENLIPNRTALSSDRKSAAVSEPKLAPLPVADLPSAPGPSRSTSAKNLIASEVPKPYVPLFNSVPDLGIPFPIKNPFVAPADLQIPKRTQKYRIL
jgi:hypothetical protein